MKKEIKYKYYIQKQKHQSHLSITHLFWYCVSVTITSRKFHLVNLIAMKTIRGNIYLYITTHSLSKALCVITLVQCVNSNHLFLSWQMISSCWWSGLFARRILLGFVFFSCPLLIPWCTPTACRTAVPSLRPPGPQINLSLILKHFHAQLVAVTEVEKSQRFFSVEGLNTCF